MPLRLLDDPLLTGPVNMARDEALLTLVGDGESPPTLRLYEWSPPTISLGYFQRYADCAALDAPAGELPTVRRLTGGGAILHDRELTYSLTIPVGHTLLDRGPIRLYEIVHDAIIAALADAGVDARRAGVSDGSGAAKGPFFCFARRHCLDVVIGGAKIAGSAQRRTRTALLQHGSIVFERRFRQQDSGAIPAYGRMNPASFRGPFLAALACGGRSRTAEGDRRAIEEDDAARLERQPGEWSSAELRLADALYAKYAGDEWMRRT